MAKQSSTAPRATTRGTTTSNAGNTRQKGQPRQSPRAKGRRGGGPPSRSRVMVLGMVLVALALGGLWLFSQLANPAPVYGAREAPDQGRDHILPGQAHPAYNTTPPTSGWHYDTPAPWGIFRTPVPDETQVHNLEHGGIMIQYWCPDSCPATVAQLESLAQRYPSKVIVAPYARPLPNRIALTAWHWIDTFDEFDERRIVTFIERHKNQGPERVPD